jgi:WD40 repeat protein/tRNA A-37 threonylcarbamoyl transferase component Bud32
VKLEHPSIHSIVALAAGADEAGGEVRDHVDGCEACRSLARLAGLGQSTPRTAATPQGTGGSDVPAPAGWVVERSHYLDWESVDDGRGGMGRVHCATDQRLGRRVAIKQARIPEGGASPRLRAALAARLEHEARLTARLQHPSIVAVYEAGRWPDGEAFYAMPFVQGVTLDKEISRRKKLRSRLELLPQLVTVAEAVAYAHQQGIVHRDLKPYNVILGRFGETTVIDWGLAKDVRAARGAPADPDAAPVLLLEPQQAQARGALTEEGVGTPHYMPPEQARGQEPDERFDVYALGATLYHLLAGMPPYGLRGPEKVRWALQAGPPKPLRELEPQTPPALAAIAERAMARDPAARFQTARELADELRRFTLGELTRSHRHTPAELVRHWARRHRAALRTALAAALVMVGLGAVAVARIVQESARAAESAAQTRAELRRSRGVTAALLAPDQRRRLEALELAVRAFAGDDDAAEGQGAPDAPPPEAVRGLLAATAAGAAATVRATHQGTISSLDVSRDGRLVVTASSDGEVRVWRPEDGSVVARCTSPLTPGLAAWFSRPQAGEAEAVLIAGVGDGLEVLPLDGRPAWRATSARVSPRSAALLADGTLLTADFMGRLRRWDRAGERGAPVELGATATAMAVSPRGLVAAGTVDGGVHLYEPATGRHLRLDGHRGEVGALLFLPDPLPNGALVSVAGDGQVLRWPLQGGLGPRAPALVYVIRDPLPRPLAALSPDGKVMAVALDPGRSALLDPNASPGPGGEPAAPLRLLDASIYTSSFSADGARLLGIGSDRHLLVVEAATGRPVARIEPTPTWRDLARFVGDGDLLVAALGSDVLVADARPGPAAALQAPARTEVVAVAFSPDGASIAVGRADGSVRWSGRAAHGPPLIRLQLGTELSALRFTPAGHLVAAGHDGLARLFAPDGVLLASLGGGAAPLTSVETDREGRRAVTASLDGLARVYELARPDGPPLLFAGHEGPLLSAVFSPDGRRVLTASGDGTARLWDAATGAPLLVLGGDGDPLTAAFFSPSGALIAAGCAAHTRLFRASDGARLEELSGRLVSSSQTPFSPDGALLATSVPGGRVLLHRVASLAPAGAAPFPAPAPGEAPGSASGAAAGEPLSLSLLSAPLALAWSPTAPEVVTAGVDRALSVWDLRTGALLRTLPGDGYFSSAAYSPRGDWLAAGTLEGAAMVVPATVAEALEEGCSSLALLGRRPASREVCPGPR